MIAGVVRVLQVTAILLSILAGFAAGTEWVAYEFGFDAQLGSPLGVIWGVPVYAPWLLFVWDYAYGAQAESVFQTAFLLCCGGISAGIGGAVLLSVWHAKRPGDATTFGSARWANSRDIQAAGLLEGRGVVLGIDAKGRYLRHDGPEHVKVIAPTRSGKGVGVVIPTLLTWPHSVLVYDLKSENWRATAGYREGFSRVICFNPNDAASAHFNPLLEVRLGDLEVRDVQNIADMIVDPEGKGMTDHWAKTGHSLLVGTILHVLYAETKKTLAGVAEFLSNPERTLVQTMEWMMHAEHVGGHTHPVVAAAARDMLNKCENERSGVLSTAMSFLSLYRDPIVARNTADSDFRITDLM
jgi:type IV secretion system protein VirD4